MVIGLSKIGFRLKRGDFLIKMKIGITKIPIVMDETEMKINIAVNYFIFISFPSRFVFSPKYSLISIY